MGNTPYYGFSYPEPPGHTRTWEYWQTQVEQIEAKLKTGFRMPDGNLSLGDPGAGNMRALVCDYKEGADVYQGQLLFSTGGFLTLLLTKNGAAVNRFRLGFDGLIHHNLSGQADRILPYSIATGIMAVPVSNSRSANTTVTLPASRFSAAPVVQATSEEGLWHVAVWPTASTASFTILVSHIDATVSTVLVGTRWLAMQMLPTAGAGRQAKATRPSVIMIATCHTAECDNAEIPIEVEIPYEEGQPPPTDPHIVCGVCGQPIDDLSEAVAE